MFTCVQNDTRVRGPCLRAVSTAPVSTGRAGKNALHDNAFCEHGPWTRALGTHYPCSRAVNMARARRAHGRSKDTSVQISKRTANTSAQNGIRRSTGIGQPCSRPVEPGAELHAAEIHFDAFSTTKNASDDKRNITRLLEPAYPITRNRCPFPQ